MAARLGGWPGCQRAVLGPGEGTPVLCCLWGLAPHWGTSVRDPSSGRVLHWGTSRAPHGDAQDGLVPSVTVQRKISWFTLPTLAPAPGHSLSWGLLSIPEGVRDHGGVGGASLGAITS